MKTLHIILLLVKGIRIQHKQLLLSEVSTALDYLHEPRIVVLHVALLKYYGVDVLGAEHLLVFYLYGALFHLYYSKLFAFLVHEIGSTTCFCESFVCFTYVLL